jgi:Tol biopolymer transport system component
VASRIFRLVGAFTLCLAAAAGMAASAQAAFPGVAGPIAYQRLALREPIPGSGEISWAGGLFTHGPKRSDHSRRLTNEAKDESPAFSPNGRLVVFASNPGTAASTRPHIYVMKTDGSGLRQLTSGPERDSNPSFSPNGRLVVFDRTTTGDEHFSHIFSVSVDGGEPIQITTGAEARDSDPTFAPNGRTIAFVSERESNGAGNRFGIFAMRPDGSRIRPLVNGRGKDIEPDFSPDGRSIAFASDRTHALDIYVAAANGRHVRRLTDARQGCFRGECFHSPSWAPDGKHIAFIAEAHYSSDLEVMRSDGSRVTKFADGGIEESGLGFAIGAPAWGPVPR